MTVEASSVVVGASHRNRSVSVGTGYFLVAASAYIVSFAVTFAADSLLLRGVLAAGNGMSIVVLFVVGHDACHGSLTPHGRLNRLLGVLSLLPSWHPYHSWAYTHNGLHHGWTNLKGRDPVYCPFTYDEFRALPRYRRVAERIYRTLPGLGLMYLVEIWWKQEIAPRRRAGGHDRGFVRDRSYVALFTAGQVTAGAFLLSFTTGGADDQASLLLLQSFAWVLLPFAVWNWMMGFATFQHHTHPRVRWYDSEEEWNRQRAQIDASVHVVFPRWVNAFLCNIMDHTAHHVDTRVPLYNLPDAQRIVEASCGDRMVVEEFSIRNLRETLRVCKLYDYRTHRWTDFEGRVASMAE